jgi:hypothetical protein
MTLDEFIKQARKSEHARPITAQEIHQTFGGKSPAVGPVSDPAKMKRLEQMQAAVKKHTSTNPDVEYNNWGREYENKPPLAQNHATINNAKAHELPPPKMTTTPEHTSGHPTANTSETAKKLTESAKNPFHTASENAGTINKVREALATHKKLYGSAAAIAMIGIGAGVLARNKHTTKEQRAQALVQEAYKAAHYIR